MISRHPTTGKPIKIIRSEATLFKNAKTLIWIEPAFEPSHRWSRWSTLLSDVNALPVLQGIAPSLVIIRTAEEVALWSHNEETVLIVTDVASRALGDISSTCLHINNLNKLYPFLHESLNDESSLETIVNAIYTLFRFQKLVTAREISSATKISMDAKDTIIPRTVWISQYFQHLHPTRARELRECLERNIACSWIDQILLLTEGELKDLPSSDKLILHPFRKRATYADTFQIAIEKIPKGNNSILIFSNSDIWFDSTLRSLWSIDLSKKVCLALLRWEGDTIFGPRPDSQDTWIVGRDTFDVKVDPFRFCYGIPGCDNIVAIEFLKQRFLVSNPAYTIKTYHNHSSSIRSYDARNDILYNDVYLYIDPTFIQPFETTNSFGTPVGGWNTSIKTFSREVGFLQKSLLTLAPYTPPTSPPLYHLNQDLFVTPEGLLSNCTTLWNHPLWATSTVHTLTPTLPLPSMIALCSAEKDPAKWMLQSFPQILRILSLNSKLHYLIPPTLTSILPDGTPREEGVQYWSQSVWALPTLPPRPTQEDIELLRSKWPSSSTSSTPTIVFLLSEDLLSLHHAEQIYRMHCVHTVDCETTTRWNVHYLHPTDALERVGGALEEADWVVGETGHALFPWSWKLKPNSIILEFQKEELISDEIAHVAGAASLRYVMGVQRFREPIEDRRQQALLDVGVAIKKYGMVLRLKELTSGGSSLPVITLPTEMTGIHVHSGDSFRAMIQLWKERGYCRVELSAQTPFCWWGTTLLYDRDTMKWMEVEKPSYKLALIGNPGVTDKLRQSKWSYWPRYPQLVERVRPRGWGERTLTSIFLGRIENGVQKKHREGDWKSVELFECPVDSSGGPYKYSPSEYLDLIGKSKFGLCLAGYGGKCYREIEYYANGTVPIAAPGCDMTGYLNPPVEGVHFLRAATSEELNHLVKTISRSTWERMSAAGRLWWKENASAEGLFRLTSNRIQTCLPYAGIGLPL